MRNGLFYAKREKGKSVIYVWDFARGKLFTFSICKVLENRSKQDEERMDQLMTQLKEARLIAEDADTKSDEISRKLAFVEDELEAAEERVKSSEAYVGMKSKIIFVKSHSLLVMLLISIHRKIMEREDELFIVGNILKSLEVSEEKVKWNLTYRSSINYIFL